MRASVAPQLEIPSIWTNHTSSKIPRLGLRDVDVPFRGVNMSQNRGTLNWTKFTSKTAALSNMTNWLNERQR